VTVRSDYGTDEEMSPPSRWIEAGGEHQLPFLTAAGAIQKSGLAQLCPACAVPLRHYHHVFQPARGTGTLWVWCRSCRRTTHLPRVAWPHGGTDPFADLSLDAFARLELKSDFLDRLDALPGA
jgi:hypothetical protein